ncbi:MAG: non-homologous end-joining DNA ligase [Nocardioides sp.]
MRPMLATKGDQVPLGPDWTHEVKWDGMRILAECGASQTRLRSRNDNDVTPAWPDVTSAALQGRDAVVDGEIIALNEHGLPDFRTLQERMHVRARASVDRLVHRVPATFMAFDLLRLDGTDLTARPLAVRRELLVEALATSSWQVPASYDDGRMLHEATLAQGLEGIVSKRLDSRYRVGERSAHWLKFAHRHRGSYVVGGWRPQEGTTDRLAALLVGEVTSDGLFYRGRVGSGIGAKHGRALAEAVAGIARATSPFDDEVPRVDAAGSRWVEPVLVVDVDTHGRGHTRLRQPSYQGLRLDLAADEL